MEPLKEKSVIKFFMAVPVFERINPEELKVVVGHLSVFDLKTGETLFNELDPGGYMCFILGGSVDVIKASGTEEAAVCLTTLKTGQSIGEMSVIEGLPRSATIKARESSTLCILSKAAFDMILERHPRIGIKLLKGIARLLSNNLRKTSSRLADYMRPLE